MQRTVRVSHQASSGQGGAEAELDGPDPSEHAGALGEERGRWRPCAPIDDGTLGRMIHAQSIVLVPAASHGAGAKQGQQHVLGPAERNVAMVPQAPQFGRMTAKRALTSLRWQSTLLRPTPRTMTESPLEHSGSHSLRKKGKAKGRAGGMADLLHDG